MEKVQLNVLLPEALDKRIRAVAAVDDEKISTAVEKAVRAYIDQRKADPEWRPKYDQWVKQQEELLHALDDEG